MGLTGMTDRQTHTQIAFYILIKWNTIWQIFCNRCRIILFIEECMGQYLQYFWKNCASRQFYFTNIIHCIYSLLHYLLLYCNFLLTLYYFCKLCINFVSITHSDVSLLLHQSSICLDLQWVQILPQRSQLIYLSPCDAY